MQKPNYITNKKELAENLKEIRSCRLIPQREVAEKLGLERSTYTYYETGKTLPDIFVLMELSNIFYMKFLHLITVGGKDAARYLMPLETEKTTPITHNYIKTKKELALRLKTIREALNISQQGVADKLYIDRSTYTYYETGKTTPDIYTVIDLSLIFGIKIMDLISENSSIKLKLPNKKFIKIDFPLK